MAVPLSYNIRNIRVLPPGGVCDGAPKVYAANAQACVASNTGNFVPFEQMAPQTWHAYYMSDARGFRVLRFMDHGQTNTSTVVE